MSDESWRTELHRQLIAGRSRKKAPRPYDSRGWKSRRSEVKDGAECCLCARFGQHVPAEVADHIVPAATAGFDGALQPLCQLCHRIKRVLEGQWRRGSLNVSELNLATGRAAMCLRASAFGVGLDGFQLVRVDDKRGP